MIRISLMSLVLAALWCGGCGRNEEAPASPTNSPAAGSNPAMAPVDYLGAVSKAKRTSEKVLDTASLNQAVQLFNAGEGRYPRDLNELVQEGYLPRLPEPPRGSRLLYNPDRGEVRIVQDPSPRPQ